MTLIIKNYDRAYRQHGPRPTLLSSYKSPNTPKKAGFHSGRDEALMADPIVEIYLCDNCGTEFISLNAIKVQIELYLSLHNSLSVLNYYNFRPMKSDVYRIVL